jgi:monoamine oxidase
LKSRNASDVAIATAAIWTRAMLGQEPEAISAIYFLNYCKSGGGLLQMRSDQKHGGQYLRIRQGTQLISTGLADALPKDTVKLSDPVISVQQLASQQNLVQTRDHAYLAHKVISAIPETVLKTLSFTPELPPAKRLLIESFRYGYYTKVMMVFKTPFWVQKGFCGLTQSFTGLAIVIRDTSSPSDSGTKHVLTCFLAGKPGQIWASKAQQERKEELIEQIGILFECPETAKEEFVQAVESEWANEPYSGYGCPCPSLPVGILDTVGHTLRELVGDIHFAGTETAEEWKGYMEGAIRSGEREATLVTKALSSISSKL